LIFITELIYAERLNQAAQPKPPTEVL